MHSVLERMLFPRTVMRLIYSSERELEIEPHTFRVPHRFIFSLGRADHMSGPSHPIKIDHDESTQSLIYFGQSNPSYSILHKN